MAWRGAKPVEGVIWTTRSYFPPKVYLFVNFIDDIIKCTVIWNKTV